MPRVKSKWCRIFQLPSWRTRMATLSVFRGRVDSNLKHWWSISWRIMLLPFECLEALSDALLLRTRDRPWLGQFSEYPLAGGRRHAQGALMQVVWCLQTSVRVWWAMLHPPPRPLKGTQNPKPPKKTTPQNPKLLKPLKPFKEPSAPPRPMLFANDRAMRRLHWEPLRDLGRLTDFFTG